MQPFIRQHKLNIHVRAAVMLNETLVTRPWPKDLKSRGQGRGPRYEAKAEAYSSRGKGLRRFDTLCKRIQKNRIFIYGKCEIECKYKHAVKNMWQTDPRHENYYANYA